MNRFGRGRRRADDWSSPHERARTRAAQRLDWTLDPDEAAWLDAHLAECRACRTLANDHLEIRTRLRGLRDTAPPPPRDLWARTAAAIEVEATRGRRTSSGRLPLGAMSGLLVVAFVLGATLLSNLPRSSVVPPNASVASVLPTRQAVVPSPAGTPLVVGAGDVAVVRRSDDGMYGYSVVGVDEVCPKSADVDCPLVRDAYATAIALLADPETIIGSPSEGQAVIVNAPNGSKANEVIVLSLPKSQPSGSPEPTPSVSASDPPSPTVAPSPSESQSTATPVATTQAPASSAPATASVSAEPTETATASPSESPDASPSESPLGSLLPSESPGAEAVAIARDLIVVGQTAAFSPDGDWFAFTARPADDSHGPDIYVWHVGDEMALPVTDDHRSVFASWTDGRLVGSRPTADVDVLEEGVEVAADAFLLDPETGEEAALAETGWRPIVAPDGSRAVVFNGTIAGVDDGRTIEPATGTLELRTWDETNGALSEDATVVFDAPISRFDARWDETGTAFAVWIEDPADPSFGRLSLFFVDPETGELTQPENAPRDEAALPGFSIGDGRLAWATPPGQGGEGSRVLIVAWTEDGVGVVESAPGAEVVVVR